jgi:hypothetical protein
VFQICIVEMKKTNQRVSSVARLDVLLMARIIIIVNSDVSPGLLNNLEPSRLFNWPSG